MEYERTRASLSSGHTPTYARRVTCKEKRDTHAHGKTVGLLGKCIDCLYSVRNIHLDPHRFRLSEPKLTTGRCYFCHHQKQSVMLRASSTIFWVITAFASRCADHRLTNSSGTPRSFMATSLICHCGMVLPRM